MTIPASQLVQVNPTVLSAGGTAIDLTGLMLTQNTRVPIGSFASYPSLAAVQQALGAGSVDAAAAAIYFASFNGATKTPGSILVAQFPTSAVAAYLRSASLASVSLATLQSFNGSLNITVDGYPRSANVNLSAAVSFSAAAASIQSSLNSSLPTEATATASISSGTLTVTGTLTGTLSVGQTVTGSNTPVGTVILSQLTGALNGTGTYTLSATASVLSQTLTFTATALSVTFDSVTNAFVIQSGITGNPSTAAYASGTLATSLSLTQTLGAVLSQGTVAATPSAFMAGIIRITQNWATFFLNFDVDPGGGNTNAQAFAQWVATTNNRYAYLAGDNDVTPTLSTNAPTSLGQIVTAAGYSGIVPIYDPNIYPIAAFVAGVAASINFDQPNGRITFAYKSQGGLAPSVTDGVVAQNLLANNYNFYGAYATANNQFQFLQDGGITGPFGFLDSYVNQIWLNAQLQLSLLEFLNVAPSIPYNPAGFGSIENSLGTTIQQALSFGAMAPGVTLSTSQAQEVNNQANKIIAPTLQARGWYLQVADPGPNVRQVRGSPICNFWYVDGESVQLISLTSIKLN